MSLLHFDKQGSFSTAVDLTMALNESTNNSVPTAQKVGYEFDGWLCDHTSGGHVDEKSVMVYNSDGTSYKATEYTVTVYENNTSWIAEYIPESDTPIVTETIKVYDSDGHAVQSDIFWSADYPNGVYKCGADATVYPIFKEVPFINGYFDDQQQQCHIYAMVDGEIVRVEVIKENRNGS